MTRYISIPDHIPSVRSLILAITLLGSFASDSKAEPLLKLAQNDVVVFMGGTNMVRLQRSGHLEALLTDRYAKSHPRFRDFAWEADTVERQGTVIERWRKEGWRRKGFGDLTTQLQTVEATVGILQFGQLESMDGLADLEQFEAAYSELLRRIQPQLRTIVLITPAPFEKPHSSDIPDLSSRNDSLEAYVEVIRSLAAKHDLPCVDLFESNLTSLADNSSLTENGMHWRDESQAAVAEEIARQLGLIEKLPRTGSAAASRFESIRTAVVEKHRLWYDYWRPANWKLLYGDDAERQFTRGGEQSVPFKQEWLRLIPLIAQAEQRIWMLCRTGEDSGHNRPSPETLHAAPEADIARELASFRTLEGLEVNLFASEEHGLTSPLNIRWDTEGRAYVTVTTTYPHLFPGDVPNDKIIVLEDTDHDGSVDRSHVFADGLNIPTGIELGHGGVYVGQNSEILFLEDTDGDLRADTRAVLLGGFGNGDSHQTINSFVWSPDGELYFGHGDGCESRVETPWGPSHLFNAGYFRMRPNRLQLVPFLSGHMAAGNPWGVAFDRWGQPFGVDGAGGVTWLTPGLVPTPHVKRCRRIGDPGGYCGIAFLDGRHIPQEFEGQFAVGDFKRNRISRFSVDRQGADFKLEWHDPIVESSHRNFRPVDVKVGPDGAIYVVDWYNPITCHQDDAYRDPTRDKAHGRIWRISSRHEKVEPPDLASASMETLLESLTSPEYWTRYQAKRALTIQPRQAVMTALSGWIQSLDPKRPDYELRLHDALGACATLEVVETSLLKRLLTAEDARARAFATRLVGRWQDRLNDPLRLLAPRVADADPLVRLEAIVACSVVPRPESMAVAARVVDHPITEWIEYGFEQTVHQLKPHWLPALTSGSLEFERSAHLAATLKEAGGEEVRESLLRLAKDDQATREVRCSAIETLLSIGRSEDVVEFGLSLEPFEFGGRYSPEAHASALNRLVEFSLSQETKPKSEVTEQVSALVQSSNAGIQTAAIRLIGLWNLKSLERVLRSTATDDSTDVALRLAAIDSMGRIDTPETRRVLLEFAESNEDTQLRVSAISSLARTDVASAARQAARLVSTVDQETSRQLLVPLMDRQGGAIALSAELKREKLTTKQARHILQTLYSTGRSNLTLLDTLNEAAGVKQAAEPYDEQRIRQLAKSAATHGNRDNGGKIFRRMACSSCHSISGLGGKIGPDLTAIGTTLSTDRIVEEVLWPNRQVKEGYSLLTVVTSDGRVSTGFDMSNRSAQQPGKLILRDLSSDKHLEIDRADIEEKKAMGSPMPPGLSAFMSQQELLDLIRYLSELGQIRNEP